MSGQMDRDAALIVAGVALQADGWCISCACSQIRALRDAFPEHDWVELAKLADPDRAHWFDDFDEDDS